MMVDALLCSALAVARQSRASSSVPLHSRRGVWVPAFAGTTAERYRGLFRRDDARREDRFEMFGAVAVDLDQEFVRDSAELLAQLARHRGGVELGAFAHDRLNGADVVGDQLRRDQIEVGRVFDDAADA